MADAYTSKKRSEIMSRIGEVARGHCGIESMHWVLEDTFREVPIDSVRLDPVMVRVLMAQNVMPSPKGRVRSMDCTACGHPQFDAGDAAYLPAAMHTCSECRCQSSKPGRTRNVVANPLPAILAGLAMSAPWEPQEHRLDLLPETLSGPVRTPPQVVRPGGVHCVRRATPRLGRVAPAHGPYIMSL